MPQMPNASSPPPPTDHPSLRQRTTHGVMWVVAQAVASRGITAIQQIALAWLLTENDFGLIGLTYTVSSFVRLMANPGIDIVLVQRLRHFRHWATPAFWFGLTMGIAGGILMLAIAPIVAWAYGRPQLIGLIGVLAIAAPIQTLQIAPKAQLQMQMRFRAIMLLGLLTSALTAAFTISAAYLGMCAYSFVIPVPIVAAIIATANWWLARPPIRLHPEFSRWKYLLGSSASVGGTGFLHTFSNQADYIALGLMGFSEAAIGTYVFAFNIALQPLQLLSSGVPIVLFPSLSHLTLEPEKQIRATLRAMRLLAMVIVPFCLLQILMAEPIFRLVFPPRWLDAVLPCQLLTLGLMFNATSWPSNSLMLAQGRFHEQFWITVIGMLGFLFILSCVMWLHPSIVSVAAGVAVWHCINSPYLHWAATRRYTTWGSYLAETCRPLLAGAVAAVACVILHKNLPETVGGNLIALIAGGLLFAAVYFALIFLLARDTLHDLGNQLAPLWKLLQRSKAADTIGNAVGGSDGS
jgi:O-antigen/teichoic acid export membrane protein